MQSGTQGKEGGAGSDEQQREEEAGSGSPAEEGAQDVAPDDVVAEDEKFPMEE